MTKILLVLGLASCGLAATSVSKVEPLNWRVPHTQNPIQVLLAGTGLQRATVTPASKGFRVEVRRISENGHYLFAYVTIDRKARPNSSSGWIRPSIRRADFRALRRTT